MPNKGAVILYVSKGKQTIEMPDLAGMTEEEAIEFLDALQAEHEVTFNITFAERYVDGAEAGKIVNTTPSPEAEFNPKDTTIFIYVAIAPDISEAEERDSSSSRSRSSSYTNSRRDDD
jgi:beta-lactam-binding protein with PASTA domain